jgi:hypothetical protein
MRMLVINNNDQRREFASSPCVPNARCLTFNNDAAKTKSEK